MKWTKNQFEGRKVVRQGTMLDYWAKVGRRLPTLPNRLRCQWSLLPCETHGTFSDQQWLANVGPIVWRLHVHQLSYT